MASIWSENESTLFMGRSKKPIDLLAYARKGRARVPERLFYIPAQRVMSLRDGMTRPFTDYRAGDPFVLRDFSQKLHEIVQNEIGLHDHLFPRSQRLAEILRRPLDEHIFGGFGLHTDTQTHQGRLVLNQEKQSLPYLVWSAGQREFVPLLLGLYWLLPPSKVSRRDNVEWVVIEEPEMGLHPNGIGAVLNLVMELRLRGYRVCISTHSPHVLDVMWALRFFQDNECTATDVLKLLGLPGGTRKATDLANTALSSDFRTYYFERDANVHDISTLDPGAEDIAEGGWGGLTEFSSRIGDLVAEVANRSQIKEP